MRRILTAAACVVALAGCGLGDDPELRANAAVLDLTTLPTEDWGCGFGFTLGTTDQRVRLSLWSQDMAPTPGTVAVDGTTWRGELVSGSDLFAQWCDDVVEPGEPEVVEEVVLEVTGTLTWRTDGTGQCDGPATATFTDGTVIAEGRTLPLPDLELRNDAFGCLAG